MLKLLQCIAILSAIMLSLSVVGIAYFSSLPPGNPIQQQTTGQQEDKNQTESQRAGGRFIRFLFPDSISIFNLLLVIATVTLAWVAIVQISYLNRAEETSSRAVEAATKTAKIAQDNLIASNRPWVMAEKIEHLEPFPNMKTYCRIGYKVDIRNSGVSVAKSVIFDSRALKFPPTWDWLADRVEDLRIGTIKLWSSKRPIDLPVGIALAPGQSISPIRCPTFSDGNDPTDEQIIQGAFLIIGYIQYTDQFGLTHHTRFAFTPDRDSVRPWDGKSFAIYNDYQDAD
jgi:hypothetical protein